MKKTATQKPLEIPVVDTQGKSVGKIALPAELFAAKVNKQLLLQAIRVYGANQRSGSASTKTRGEVEGSTRKIYRQKGTGRARHGSIRAPIFVGGGIVFGPKPRDYHLDMPQKMKRAALASALTLQYQDGKIAVIDGLEKLTLKTKLMVKALNTLDLPYPLLFILSKEDQSIKRIVRNIASVTLIGANQIHPYIILKHKSLLFTKRAIATLYE